MFNFYVRLGDKQFGPLSATELSSMELPLDALVTEASMCGEWLPHIKFDFEQMAQNEIGEHNNGELEGQRYEEFEEESSGNTDSKYNNQSFLNNTNVEITNEDNKEPAGTGALILSLLIPLAGIIFYFIKKNEVSNPYVFISASVLGFIVDFLVAII